MQQPLSSFSRLGAFLRSCFHWDKAFFRSVLLVSVPMVVQELLGASLHIIDGMMVSGLGDAAYSAVMQANRFTFVCQLFLFGIMSGGAIYISQFWGARDIPRLRQSMGMALGAGIIMAFLFSSAGMLFPRQIIAVFLRPGPSFELAVSYLRIIAPGYLLMAVNFAYASTIKACEKTYIPMLSGMMGILTNTVFNYLLIYGKLGFPALGVEGAAIATVLASVVTLAINLGFAYGKKLPAGARFRDMAGADLAFVKQFLRTVLPVIANEGLWGLGTTMYSVFYGTMGDTSIAALGVANTVNDLAWVVSFGITNATAILVGKTLGEGLPDRAYLYAKRLFAAGVAGSLALGTALLLGRGTLVGFFSGLSLAARDRAQLLILLAAVGFSLRTVNCINIVGVLRSGGDTLFSLFLDVGTLWLLNVPLVGIATLVFHWPVEVVYLFTYVDEVIKIFIGLYRFKSRKWIHVLTGAKEESSLGNT